jgi:LAO/AO transport system kinase
MTTRVVRTDDLVAGVRTGSRACLGRAITLVESTLPGHRAAARGLLAALAPYAGGAHRIGISGVPGAGKSTFIDAFGSMLTARGHRVAVLAVDPSSTRTGGSILGDVTRMSRLSGDPAAYVRASPSGGGLGGTGRATRAAITVAEAAGYDVVIVETVGVGQSETAVAELVDSFLLLGVTGTGDRLQGIKRGVLEFANLIVVNKADGDRVAECRRAARELAGALRMLRPPDRDDTPAVLVCSGRDGTGLPEVWEWLDRRHRRRMVTGELAVERRRQDIDAAWRAARIALLETFGSCPAVAAAAPPVLTAMGRGAISPAEAADRLLAAFLGADPPAAKAAPPLQPRDPPPAAPPVSTGPSARIRPSRTQTRRYGHEHAREGPP